MKRLIAFAAFLGASALSMGACGSTGDEDEVTDVDGGGGTGGGGDQCPAYCAKLKAAGCAPDDCATDCTGKLTCVGSWIAKVSCVAERGTVSCDAGQPSFQGCKTQSQSYANCVNQSDGDTGGAPGSCAGHCGDEQRVPGSTPACFCDDVCEIEGDCCDDKATECPIAPDGVCTKFCCASSDCGAGEKCAALNADAIGTLGACVPSGASDSGSTTDAGSSDAGADASDLDLPAGCILDGNPACNPVTNAPCGLDAACALGRFGVECFVPSSLAPGAACSTSGGPFCIGGYHCLSR